MREFARRLYPEAAPEPTRMTTPADDTAAFTAWALAHQETDGP